MNELEFKFTIKHNAYRIDTYIYNRYVDYIIYAYDTIYYRRANLTEDWETLKGMICIDVLSEIEKYTALDHIIDYLLNGKRVIDWFEYSPIYTNEDYYTLYTSAVEVDGYKKICIKFEDDNKISERLVNDHKFDELIDLIELAKDVDKFNYLHDEIIELIEI